MEVKAERWKGAYFGCVQFLDQVESVFCAVLVFRNGASEFLEEELHFSWCAAVHLLAEGEDDQAVEESHDAVAWLMYG